MQNNFIKQKNNTQNKPKKSPNSRNRVLAYVLLAFMIFWTVGSIFGVISFFRKHTDDYVQVYADELSYSYQGSNFYVTGSSATRSSSPQMNISGSGGLNHLVQLGFSDNGESSLTINFEVRLVPSTYYPMNIYSFSDGEFISSSRFTFVKGLTQNYCFGFASSQTPSYTSYPNFPLVMQVHCDEGFNCNVQRVRFYSYLLSFNNVTGTIRNTVQYYDNNSNSLRFEFMFCPALNPPNDITAYNYLRWDDRTYYTSATILSGNSSDDLQEAWSQGYQSGKDFGYDQGIVAGRQESQDDIYQSGYDNGLTLGKTQGYNQGYQSGKSAGIDEGYANGYSQGVLESNQYSFLGLFGAVIDAPIQALSGLLNFDLLGFNMLNLFTGLITLALIVFVIRLIW